MSPGGSYHMQDLDEAGGISAVMKELTKLASSIRTASP